MMGGPIHRRNDPVLDQRLSVILGWGFQRTCDSMIITDPGLSMLACLLPPQES